jgi:serine protease Do
MKTTTFVATVCAAALLSPSVFAQTLEPREQARSARDFMMLAGRGAEIGVQVAEGKDGGVLVEEVRPDSPAEKAGLKRNDVIVDFDGERVRSTRQFGRLVQETPPGRTVKATVMRDGRRQELQITPQVGRGVLSGRGRVDGDLFREQLPNFDLRDLPRGGFFNFSLPELVSDRRLGVTVEELTDQLAQYFGARDGVLVTSVADGSAASRAGLKAGDVITAIDGPSIRSREDVARALRDSRDEEVKIGIVRDRKDTTVTAKIESPSRRRGIRL